MEEEWVNRRVRMKIKEGRGECMVKEAGWNKRKKDGRT